jgi:hypothetical protein
MVAQHQRETEPIIMTTVIGDDHKLVLDLPPDTPTGRVQIRLVVSPTEAEPVVDEAIAKWGQERERIRAKLAAAGALSTVNYDIPEDLERPSEEAIWQAGTLPPGSPSSEKILRELRDDP